MKISIKNLRSLIKEEIMLPLGELEGVISQMHPEEVAQDDYADSETGEIYLEKGKKARTSSLNPQYVKDHQKKREDMEKIRASEQEQWDKEDAEEEAKMETFKDDTWMEYQRAAREFANNWTEHSGFDKEDASSIAYDVAEDFFRQYPQWKKWVRILDIDKHEIFANVAELVHEAITTGSVPE